MDKPIRQNLHVLMYANTRDLLGSFFVSTTGLHLQTAVMKWLFEEKTHAAWHSYFCGKRNNYSYKKRKGYDGKMSKSYNQTSCLQLSAAEHFCPVNHDESDWNRVCSPIA